MEVFEYKSKSVKSDESKIAICIPAYKEENVFGVIESLALCKPCNSEVSVFVLINASEEDEEANKQVNYLEFEKLKHQLNSTQISMDITLLFDNYLPAKKAGVGLARKTVMDFATANHNGELSKLLLLCLDADCTVSENYLIEIEAFFRNNPKINAASIYFEHPFPQEVNLFNAIVEYELHLRYLKNALKKAGYPWYYHTVGSSMVVRAAAYIQQGRMNTRQAGEDYYFLHKHMPLGFGEIVNCSVFPQVRISDRVPFGTGRSMGELSKTVEGLTTYHPQIFRDLGKLFELINNNSIKSLSDLCRVELSEPLNAVLFQLGFNDAVEESLTNSKNEMAARQRLLKWFSGFTIVKIMHMLRDLGYSNVNTNEACNNLFNLNFKNNLDCLIYFRELDKTI